MILPLGLQREVDARLRLFLSQKPMSKGSFSDNSLSRSEGDEGFYEQQEPLIKNSVVMERILQRRSLQLRDKQQDWQVYLKPAKLFQIYIFWLLLLSRCTVILPGSSNFYSFNIYYLFIIFSILNYTLIKALSLSFSLNSFLEMFVACALV